MSATVVVCERPILMSGPMVRATLRERDPKTQTRRVAKLPADVVIDNWGHPFLCVKVPGGWRREGIACPYGDPGDRLWVREAHCVLDMRPEVMDSPDAVAPTGPWPAGVTYDRDRGDEVLYENIPADEWRPSFDNDHQIWRPSIHMPRWASRITLELTGVRVERVQDISEEDAQAEGITKRGVWWDVGADWHGDGRDTTARGVYRWLWDSLNAKRGYGWDANPYVWVLEFRRLAA